MQEEHQNQQVQLLELGQQVQVHLQLEQLQELVQLLVQLVQQVHLQLEQQVLEYQLLEESLQIQENFQELDYCLVFRYSYQFSFPMYNK